jgi:putative ABC transport system permease protein
VIVNLVSGGFFRALQVPVAKGRVFGDPDDSRSPRVAMLSASLARRLWPDRDPVGERIRLGLGWPEGDYAQVIGIAGDVRYGPLGQPASDAVYLPFTQMAYEETLLALRHDIDTRRLVPILRARLAQVDPTLPLYDVATLEERVATSISQARFSAILLGVFAAVGLILAAVGVYGVMAFAVSLRTREMGIRVALGATPRSVLTLVLRDGMILAGVGIAAGLAVSLAGARLLEGDLYGLSPLDPTTYVILTAFMAATAAAACLVPAVRVLRANPLTALREE